MKNSVVLAALIAAAALVACGKKEEPAPAPAPAPAAVEAPAAAPAAEAAKEAAGAAVDAAKDAAGSAAEATKDAAAAAADATKEAVDATADAAKKAADAAADAAKKAAEAATSKYAERNPGEIRTFWPGKANKKPRSLPGFFVGAVVRLISGRRPVRARCARRWPNSRARRWHSVPRRCSGCPRCAPRCGT